MRNSLFRVILFGIPFLLVGPNVAHAQGATSRIVFSSRALGEGYDCLVMDDDGDNVSNLTLDLEFGCTEPTICPNGLKIVYQSEETPPILGASDVYIMDSDGANKTNLTDNTNIEDERPECGRFTNESSDTIVWSSNRDSVISANDIYKMDLSGGNVTRLTFTTVAHEFDATICGANVVYVRSGDIWIMRKDGTNQRNLSCTSGGPLTWEGQPRCHGNGAAVVYHRDTDIYRLPICHGSCCTGEI